MKKLITILGCAVFAFTACNKTELEEIAPSNSPASTMEKNAEAPFALSSKMNPNEDKIIGRILTIEDSGTAGTIAMAKGSVNEVKIPPHARGPIEKIPFLDENFPNLGLAEGDIAEFDVVEHPVDGSPLAINLKAVSN